MTGRLTKSLIFVTLLMLFALVISGFQTYSQSIKGALIAGINLTQVDGDEVYGYKKIGWNIGPSAMIPLKNNFSIQIETLFSQKGAYQKFSPQQNDSTPYYNLRLNYLEVPVLLTYNDRNIITAGSGFSWSRLSNMTEMEHGMKVHWADKRGAYARDDLQWLVDLRFRMFWKIHMNLRYSYSLIPIRHRTYISVAGTPWERKQYNNVLTFRLVWIFNEKLPLKD